MAKSILRRSPSGLDLDDESLFGSNSSIVTTNEFFETNLSPIVQAILYTWTGSAWVNKPIKAYVGGSFVIKPLKVWSGIAWITAT